MRRAVLLGVVGLAVCAPGASASPDISYAVHGPLNNGWYAGNVVLNWSVTDPQGFTVDFGCEPSISLTADTTGTTRECKATSADGTSASKGVLIRIDKTPPSATVHADRAPDAGGFYNHALTAAWTATDATSGVASCTSTPYGGPDGTGLALTGTCRDQAGNVSPAVPFAFNYDSTPPALTNVVARPDDAGARLAWRASGAATITVMRSPSGARAAQGAIVYKGTGDGFRDSGLKNGRRYKYLVQAVDVAGNATSDSVSVTPDPDASTRHLLSPGSRSRLTRPPMLRWREIKAASYYNVQLFRGGQKILSAWPTQGHYQLRRAWTYGGQRHRLGKGTYEWFLWGGYGRRSEHRYGHLLGKRTFTIT